MQFVWPVKIKKTMENPNPILPEPEVITSYLFLSNQQSTSKIQFTIIKNSENQQIITYNHLFCISASRNKKINTAEGLFRKQLKIQIQNKLAYTQLIYSVV